MSYFDYWVIKFISCEFTNVLKRLKNMPTEYWNNFCTKITGFAGLTKLFGNFADCVKDYS
jgi:hypothetical protein